jgi:hypothetical protein
VKVELLSYPILSDFSGCYSDRQAGIDACLYQEKTNVFFLIREVPPADLAGVVHLILKKSDGLTVISTTGISAGEI